MSIFSYVVVHDTGFAPNPYAGFLTLATCKPRIRRVARPGDWVVGTGSVRGVGVGHAVYVAHVAEVVTIEAYGREVRFQSKIPRVSGAGWVRHGDNIYFCADGRWQQRRNQHHAGEHMKRDLSGRNVLIAHDFWCFGETAPVLPPSLQAIIKTGPGHKRIDDPELEKTLQGWLARFPAGISEPSRDRRQACDA